MKDSVLLCFVVVWHKSFLVCTAPGQYWDCHDDVIKWKHFPRYWPFVRGIHRSPVNSPHKGQWRGALMFSLICVWINGWVNTREAGDLRRYRVHYDVTVMAPVLLKQHCRITFSTESTQNNNNIIKNKYNEITCILYEGVLYINGLVLNSRAYLGLK